MGRATSEAYRLDAQQYGFEAAGREEFVAIEGGKLDARARQGIQPLFARIALCCALVAFAFFALGGVAVSLTSGTVSLLQENNAVTSQIKDARALNGDLRIERSLLTRSERITQIATQNLGMVYANTADHLDLG